MLGCQRARMGQGFFEEFGSSEEIPDFLAEVGGQSMPVNRCPSIDALDAVEQPAIPYRERPFPDFLEPGRSIGREKDELGFPNQVLGRYVADGR